MISEILHPHSQAAFVAVSIASSGVGMAMGSILTQAAATPIIVGGSPVEPVSWLATATLGVVALGTLGGLLVQVLNYRTANKAAMYAMQAHSVALKSQENIQKIETATNSMKDALVQATADAKLLEGNAAGRAEQKAEQASDAVPVAAAAAAKVSDDRFVALESMMGELLKRLPVQDQTPKPLE